MVYEIRKESKVILAGTKEDVVKFIVSRDAQRLGCTPDINKARFCGEATRGFNPDVYVPTFFDEVAMNPNDTRAITGIRYSVVPTKPTRAFYWADKAARPYIVTDESGRVVDVRDWLEDCRTALRNSTNEPAEFPYEARPVVACRNPSGLRQALSVPYMVYEDYLELVGSVPSRLTRMPRGKDAGALRRRNISKSWKDTKGCVRSWQKKTARGRMPTKLSLPLDIDALAAELVSAS